MKYTVGLGVLLSSLMVGVGSASSATNCTATDITMTFPNESTDVMGPNAQSVQFNYVGGSDATCKVEFFREQVGTPGYASIGFTTGPTNSVIWAPFPAGTAQYHLGYKITDTSDSSTIKEVYNAGIVGFNFLVDNTPPTVSSVETQDLDGNGKLDFLKVTFTEDSYLDNTREIDDSKISLNNGYTVKDMADISTYPGYNAGIMTTKGYATGTNPKIIYIPINEDKGYNTSVAGVNLQLTINADSNIKDIVGNTFTSVTNQNSTDKAAPVMILVKNYDVTTDNGTTAGSDGQNDEIYVTFSENVSNGSIAHGDFLIDTNGDGIYETSASLKAFLNVKHGQTDALNDQYITLKADTQMTGTAQVGVQLTAGSISEENGAGNNNLLMRIS